MFYLFFNLILFFFLDYISMKTKNILFNVHNIYTNYVPKYINYKLKNGLNVVIFENQALPIIDVRLIFNKPKTLDFLEINMNDILKFITMSKFDDYIDNIMDYMDSNINLDSSASSINIISLVKYFKKSFFLFKKVLFNNFFICHKEHFDFLHEQLINEYKKNFYEASNTASDFLKYLIFNNPGVSKKLFTYRNKEFKMEDIKKFYYSYFRPNNSCLVLYGDVKYSVVKKIIFKYFSSWKYRKIPQQTYKIPNKFSGFKIVLINNSSNKVNISVGGYLGLNKNLNDYFPLVVANDILYVGNQSRLFKNLREDKGYTYSISSFISKIYQPYLYYKISSNIKPEYIHNSIIEYLKELKDVCNNVTDKELTIKKKEMIGRFIIRMENKDYVIDCVVNQILNKFPKHFFNNYIDNINKVSNQDISRVVKKYFCNNTWILVSGNLKKIIPELKKNSYTSCSIMVYDRENKCLKYLK